MELKPTLWEYYVWLPYSMDDKFTSDLKLLGELGWELVLKDEDTFIFNRPAGPCTIEENYSPVILT